MANVLRTTTVARDGFHNGFTDLQHWQSLYWVSYRKGSAHATLDGEAVISVSVDRHRFREAARVKIYGDNRDPKLFPITDERMAMTIPSWEGAYRADALRQYITFTSDGFNWETPRRILDDGHWLWRIREHDGRYYGLVQRLIERPDRKKKQHNLLLMTSADLLDWQHLAMVGPDSQELNESDIYFHEDGSAWIVARSVQEPGHSYFAHAQPPYTEWQTQSLGVLIHAPIILEHNGALYVSGRSRPADEGIVGFPSRTSLGVWKLTFGQVEPVLRIPAMGDCSYPGLIKDPEGNVCLTYYSQHAYLTGVCGSTERGNTKNMADDVYFAELELD